jgi:Serine/threonine protein kinase
MPPAGPPDVIAHRYELGQVLGRGGMGEVRAGTDLALGREVAVKFLRRDLAEQAPLRRRFEREARAAARITHPHVVAIYDIGEHDGLPYIVMERLSGRTLADELGDGAISEARACSLVLEILSALDAAHQQGVLHRDIKPGNVLLAPDGHAKVADFGIAKLADDFDQTTTGMLLGTAAYLAPERLAGGPATPASDLYSVGVLLFEALAGQPAFSAETPLALVASISSGVPIPLNQVRDGIEPAVVATVERAMAVDPDGRFDSATTMAAALVAATRQSAPTTADTPTVPVASGPALRVPPTLPERAVGSTAPRAAMPRVAPTEVLVDAKSAVPAKPTKFRRRSKPRAAVLAGLLVFLAAGLFATRELSDGGPTPAKPASTTTTPGGNTIPTPLQRALDELDRSVRP